MAKLHGIYMEFKKWAPGDRYKIHNKKHKHIGLKSKPDILAFSYRSSKLMNINSALNQFS